MQGNDHERQVHSTTLMIFTLLSRVLGIFKARVLAVLFGASMLGDVINFTFNIPNNFRKLFAEGAFNSAFIPIFTRTLHEKKDARSLLKQMVTIQLILFSGITLIVLMFNRQIISFLSDFSDPSMITLSGNLLIFFTLYLVLISLYALFTGVLNVHGEFMRGAAAPLIFSMSLIASLYLLEPYIGAYAMAVGVIVGGGGQLVFTWIKLRSYGYTLRLTRNPFTDETRQIMKKWGFITVNALIAIISQQVAYYFASTLVTGSVTSFANAIIIWQAPYGIFYAAIATAFFPQLVKAASLTEKTQLHHITRHGITLLVATLFPNLLLLYFFGSETASVLLQSGEFTLQDSIRTGEALTYFAIGMPAAALYGFFQRICYADDREKQVFIIAIIIAAVDITLTAVLIRMNPSIASIALANTCSFILGSVIYMVYLSTKGLIQLVNRTFLLKVTGILAVNAVLAILLSLLDRWLGSSWWSGGSSFTSLGILSAIFASALLSALGLYRMIGVNIISFIRKSS